MAIVIMSGVTFQCSIANIEPVLPNPVITSSAINMTPYLSHICRSIGQYSSPGTAAPIEEEIGSATTAATLEAPWNFIRSSTAWAHRAAHSESVSPGIGELYESG